jgi:predicted DNA-binding mobile mystery protein A
MNRHRASRRRAVDLLLADLAGHVRDPPPGGWLKVVREAIGMSSYQLAKRMGLSPTRVRQLEPAEVEGTIRLSTLQRAAHALNCKLFYVLVPNESLDDMVHRQAFQRAAEQLCVWGAGAEHPSAGDLEQVPRERIDELEDLALRFVDHRDLWR